MPGSNPVTRRTLAELVDPARTAVVTQECQGAIVGEGAGLVELAAETRREALPNLVRLLPVARSAGVHVVHCLAQRRLDGRGANSNARLFAAVAGLGLQMAPGTPGGSLVPELGPEPSDLVLTRLHGVGPMGGTDLDAVLRNLGVTTIVATGVSLNIAIPNLVMDAVNHGYDVVLPSDAVAGVPVEHATSMIEHTLSLLATVTTTADLVQVWAD